MACGEQRSMMMSANGDKDRRQDRHFFPARRNPELPQWRSHTTRLLSADEVFYMCNDQKKTRPYTMESGGPRQYRTASASEDMSGGSQSVMDENSDITSDGTLSRCTSTDRISLADGQVEDRFRVDRRKLEAMILGKYSL